MKEQNNIIFNLNNIEEKIKYLEDKQLAIQNKENIKKYIENYGFTRLFLALSKPFKDENDIFLKNVNEYSFLELYYFDNDFANIFSLYMGYFEHRLSSNIVAQIDYECPELEEQFFRFLDRKKRKNVINLIKTACKEDNASYLLPYVNKNIYPASIFINFLTLGDKQYLLDKLSQIDSKIPENFNLRTFSELKLIVDIIRNFRNNSNHYNKLIRYEISLKSDDKKKLKEIFQKTLINKNLELYNKIEFILLSNETQNYNSFLLAVLLSITLGSAQAIKLVEDIKEFFEKSINKIKNFNVSQFLYDEAAYNWPNLALDIIQQIAEMKKIGILRSPTFKNFHKINKK